MVLRQIYGDVFVVLLGDGCSSMESCGGLLWPLLLYKVPMTTVEEMVGTITQFLLHEAVKISE